MIVEDVTKEEREAGKKGTILGNAKIMGKQQQSAPQNPSGKHHSRVPQDDVDDDIPF
jgi:hypothetical protein